MGTARCVGIGLTMEVTGGMKSKKKKIPSIGNVGFAVVRVVVASELELRKDEK